MVIGVLNGRKEERVWGERWEQKKEEKMEWERGREIQRDGTRMGWHRITVNASIFF